MAPLRYSTYVAPPKPAVSDDLPPGGTQRTWSPTTATLISGERDAILVDALMTVDEATGLADWIAATGRNLATIFITHGHGDHFFGTSVVLDRFPTARVVAAAHVVERMQQQLGPRWLDDIWRVQFPGQLPDRLVVAEPLTDHTLDLEGERLVVVELGHSDTDDTTALYVPSIGLVVAGDSVYNDVHLYLGEAGSGGIAAWLTALDTVEALRPTAVVAGHKRDGADDGPHIIEETRDYLRDFEAGMARTKTTLELYDYMVTLHPGRVNRGVLWDSARAVKG
ncbi:MBL fold metallo-hydrolase [Micromonospora sp. NBC_01699]|uniref:MBL fold metallo-hydrolase n=1 Tax=Micromonospora sp. NBC_01699 TaxID=2975984 RepID=UPI002E2DC600|nr:MBL fold metallo-hydrolase [Micromonospora sp. NBC_01699]